LGTIVFQAASTTQKSQAISLLQALGQVPPAATIVLVNLTGVAFTAVSAKYHGVQIDIV
jgi:hypothetical protein